MKRLIMRIVNILVRPREEWQAIRDEGSMHQDAYLGYVTVLAMVPPFAAVAERVLFGRAVAGSQPLGYVAVTNLLWYFLIIVNILITAAVITAVVPDQVRRLVSLQGLQLASYSFTPLFLVGVLLIIPWLNWFLYVAILYSIYLLALGIRTMTGMVAGKAAGYAAASFFAAGLIVGVLNGIEYMLESFIAAKVFF